MSIAIGIIALSISKVIFVLKKAFNVHLDTNFFSQGFLNKTLGWFHGAQYIDDEQ